MADAIRTMDPVLVQLATVIDGMAHRPISPLMLGGLLQPEEIAAARVLLAELDPLLLNDIIAGTHRVSSFQIDVLLTDIAEAWKPRA